MPHENIRLNMHSNLHLLGQKNIGPTIAKRLQEIGVETIKNLQSIGPAGAYKKLQRLHPEETFPVCYYLYSLQGALDGIHWNDLPGPVKERLLKEAGIKKTRRSKN
jgi:DNA transformation protein